MAKDEVFISQIEQKIRKFDEESTSHKHMYRRFRYIVFFLAAVTSILSGAAIGYQSIQTELNLLIVVVGAITGIATSIEGIRRPNDLWILERNIYYTLLDLKEQYEFESAGDEPVDIEDYFKRMQEILNASKEKWAKKIKLEQDKTDNANAAETENYTADS